MLRSVPRWMVHLTLAYTGRHLIKDLPAEYGPRWWSAKLLLCPSLMIHLDLFGLAADGSRAAMAYAAHALPWASLRALTTAARCVGERHVERQPASLYGRTMSGALSSLDKPASYVVKYLLRTFWSARRPPKPAPSPVVRNCAPINNCECKINGRPRCCA